MLYSEKINTPNPSFHPSSLSISLTEHFTEMSAALRVVYTVSRPGEPRIEAMHEFKKQQMQWQLCMSIHVIKISCVSQMSDYNMYLILRIISGQSKSCTSSQPIRTQSRD